MRLQTMIPYSRRVGLTVALLTSATLTMAQTPVAKPAVAPAASKASHMSAAPTAFGWYAEVVSFDAATRTLTAKAKVEPHVAGRAKAFKSGDRVVLAWTAFKHEADAVRYVASEKGMAAESGYLVRGRFVGVDAASSTLTFATTVPVAAAASLGTAKTGTSIRVAAPFLQPGPESVITSVALGKTAPARPAPAVVAKAVESARPVAGAWEVATSMMGNNIKLMCTFIQDGSKIGGTCNGPGPLASLPANGKIEGDDVTFGFSIQQPVALTLLHKGKLDGPGGKIQGTLDLMGNVSDFTATKQ